MNAEVQVISFIERCKEIAQVDFSGDVLYFSNLVLPSCDFWPFEARLASGQMGGEQNNPEI